MEDTRRPTLCCAYDPSLLSMGGQTEMVEEEGKEKRDQLPRPTRKRVFPTIFRLRAFPLFHVCMHCAGGTYYFTTICVGNHSFWNPREKTRIICRGKHSFWSPREITASWLAGCKNGQGPQSWVVVRPGL